MQEATNSHVTTSVSQDKYYGIKGWLLILIIGMTIGAPLYNIYESLQIEKVLGGSSKSFEVYSAIILFAIIISEILAVISSVYMFRKDIRGIKFAKFYIYFWIGVSVLLLIIPPIGFASLIRNSIFAWIWLKYFKKSKRVKTTFKEDSDLL